MIDRPTFVVGDIHGQLAELTVLLRETGFMSESLTWTGGDASLWFLGDFADRGPSGLAVIDLVMWLQREAETAGGSVNALIGNHDLLLVAARRFGGGFLSNWLRNGGITSDLKGLKARHASWLTSLPAMARVGQTLLIHADTTSYALHGSTVESANTTFATKIASANPSIWELLLVQLSERRAFDTSSPGGTDRAEAFLRQFGASRLVHGHTPITFVTDKPSETIEAPLVYANGRCVNVDGGLYLGGPGFIYELEDGV